MTRARVLVVDDDAEMCELLEASLASTFEVSTSTAAERALAVLRTTHVDVLVTDLRMSGMQGIDLCRAALDVQPDLAVIVITSFGSLGAAIESIRAGAYDFVTKPFPLETITVCVERAVQHRKLKSEVRRLEEEVRHAVGLRTVVGASAAIERVRALVGRVAASEASVLLTGESGTGKELVARAIHDASPRAAGPFVAINCAALPESLLEAELFGHVKGAFTDARRTRAGLFVQADAGTLFLDEVGDMPLGLQPKLLRALQERSVRPVGGDVEVPFDVRVIAATNRDLEGALAERGFREDLYYRLNVVEVALPPLRVRGEDILLLAQHFLLRCASRDRKPVTGFTSQVADVLLRYSWPGNVRELANCIERGVALTSHERVVVDDLPERVRAEVRRVPLPLVDPPAELVTLEELERRYILQVFEAVGRSRTLAAQVLGVDRKTLYRKLERYGSSS